MSETTNRDDIAREGTGLPIRAVQTFIREVGERVRQARLLSGMSRRAVSERSGVSLRYLAQLEGGGGNISIALLYRVAHALGRRVDWFVGDVHDAGPDAAELMRLFRSADAGQRRRVMEVLGARSPARSRRHRIALIGVRGAGKSTLGKMVGEALSMPFVELNSAIEEQSGMPVDEVIALYGQEGFRGLERQALERIVSSTDEVIVAVAGGIVSEPDAYDYLLRNFHTIWLKASPAEHMNRVRAQGDYRPMAGNPQAMDELRSILTRREARYANADKTVDTSGNSVEDSARHVLGAIEALDLDSSRIDGGQDLDRNVS